MNEKLCPKRGRGRPTGTGIDDAVTLKAVADILATNPGMRPTTAMKRCVEDIEASPLRRLQEKWTVNGAALLAEAEQRVRERQAAQTRRAEAVQRGSASGVPLAGMRGIAYLFDPTSVRALQAAADTFGMQRFHDLIDPPGLRAMRELGEKISAIVDPPALRAIRDMIDSPAMRAAREFAESPTMRAVKAFAESPAMKEMQRMQEVVRQMDLFGRGHF